MHKRAAFVRSEGMPAVAYEALDKWFTPAFRDREPFLRMQLETPVKEYALGLEAIAAFDLRDELKRIRASPLVIADPEVSTLVFEMRSQVSGSLALLGAFFVWRRSKGFRIPFHKLQ